MDGSDLVPDNQERVLFVTTVGDTSYLHLLMSEVEAIRPLPCPPAQLPSLPFDEWRRNLDAMVDDLAATIKARALYTLNRETL